jgi:hypothetical protein
MGNPSTDNAPWPLTSRPFNGLPAARSSAWKSLHLTLLQQETELVAAARADTVITPTVRAAVGARDESGA